MELRVIIRGMLLQPFIVLMLLMTAPGTAWAMISHGSPGMSSGLNGPDWCDHVIESNVIKVDGRGNYAGIAPGDTVCIRAGTRDRLRIKNLRGTADHPITFVNYGGQVIVDSTSGYGIRFDNSRFFHLTGTGDAEVEYGIKIKNASNYGVKIGWKSSDFEVDHVEITNIGLIGVSAQTKSVCPDGSTNDYDYDGDGSYVNDPDDVVDNGNFVQLNSVFHHIYMKNIAHEGFYIGSSFFGRGRTLSCASGDTMVYDPVLKGVRVYSNIVKDTGWDGIQVGSAVEDCVIHHNRVYRDSKENEHSQRSGIGAGGGSVCDIYNNFVKDSASKAIRTYVFGDYKIYNNVVVNPGQQAASGGNNGGDGVIVMDRGVYGHNVSIWNNTVVNPKNFGLKFVNDMGSGNRIQNNIVIAPGNYELYGESAYIQTWGRDNVLVSANLMSQDTSEVRFIDPDSDDYSIFPDSPAIDAGVDLSSQGIGVDYLGTVRPHGSGYDIGAYESVSGTPDTPTPTYTPTVLPTNTATATSTSTPTNTPTPLPTDTPVPTNTPTSTPTPTDTPSPTYTPTVLPTNTATATSTSTPTNTPTPLPTDTLVPTNTPTSTDTPSPTYTPTVLPTNTATATSTSTPTTTPTPLPTDTLVPTNTPTWELPFRPTPLPTGTPIISEFGYRTFLPIVVR